MTTIKAILIGLGVFILVFALGFGLRFLSIKVERFFRPMEENVNREVFEETKSYNEGMEQQLVKYRKEYMMAKDEQTKAAIVSAVCHAYGDYDESKLSPELADFVSMCKYGE